MDDQNEMNQVDEIGLQNIGEGRHSDSESIETDLLNSGIRARLSDRRSSRNESDVQTLVSGDFENAIGLGITRSRSQDEIELRTRSESEIEERNNSMSEEEETNSLITDEEVGGRPRHCRYVATIHDERIRAVMNLEEVE